MSYGFNDDKSKAQVYTKDEAYSKDEVGNLIKVTSATKTNVSFPANARTNVLVPISVPSGYKLAGAVGVQKTSSGSGWDGLNYLVIADFIPKKENNVVGIEVYLKNISNTAYSNFNVTVHALLVKSDFIDGGIV